MEKLLVFGGTFNPVHNGHIRLYRHFADRLGAQRVLMIPAHIPPHKHPQELASGEARMEMCRLATRDDPRVAVSDMELLRDGASYTSDTLHTLCSAYPGAELYLIVGSDMLLTIDTWHEAAVVLQLATVCALARHDGEYDALRQKARELEAAYNAHFLIDDTQALDISSTQLRAMVKQGEDISRYVPPDVEAYMKRNGIYCNADV